MPKSVSCVSIKSSTLGILQFLFLFYPPPPCLATMFPLVAAYICTLRNPFWDVVNGKDPVG
jgi:hypothetical protein